MVKNKLVHFIYTVFQKHALVKEKGKPTKYRDFFYSQTLEQPHNRNRKKPIVTADMSIIVHQLFIPPASKHCKCGIALGTGTAKLWCGAGWKMPEDFLYGRGLRQKPAAETSGCCVALTDGPSATHSLSAGPRLITRSLLSDCLFSWKRRLHSPH